MQEHVGTKFTDKDVSDYSKEEVVAALLDGDDGESKAATKLFGGFGTKSANAIAAVDALYK